MDTGIGRARRARRHEAGVTLLVTVVMILLVGILVLTSIGHSGDESVAGARARSTARALHAADGLMFCRTEYQNRAIHMQWMRAEPEIKLRDQEQPAPAPEAEAEPASPGEEYLRQSRLLNEGEATGEPHE